MYPNAEGKLKVSSYPLFAHFSNFHDDRLLYEYNNYSLISSTHGRTKIDYSLGLSSACIPDEDSEELHIPGAEFPWKPGQRQSKIILRGPQGKKKIHLAFCLQFCAP